MYIAAMIIILAACEKKEEILITKNIPNNSTGSFNRNVRPIMLGNQKMNPYTIKYMQAALDTLFAYPDELPGCLRAPSSLNNIEITTTDLYVRFLPKDSVEYNMLIQDTTMTLFDFPLDYEIQQTGDYYFNPTVIIHGFIPESVKTTRLLQGFLTKY